MARNEQTHVDTSNRSSLKDDSEDLKKPPHVAAGLKHDPDEGKQHVGDNLRRKLASHICKKSQRWKEALERGGSEKDLDTDNYHLVRVNNNMSLQITRHTSRHTRYFDDDDDSSTESDGDEDSFFDDLTPAKEVDEDELQQSSSLHAAVPAKA
jgi:hypothetical protein